MPNGQYLQSLRRSLDKVLENKQSICNQLNELVEQENMIKAKMRPQDIDEVMKLIKEGQAKAKSGQAVMPSNEIFSQSNITSHVLPSSISSNGFGIGLCKQDPLETISHPTHNTTDPNIEMDQLDSTLVVADTSANNSNVINCD